MEKIEYIPSEEYVLRCIYPAHHTDGILDSPAFNDKGHKEPSVYWEKRANIDNIMKIHSGFDFFWRLRVGDIREKGHDVEHRPDREHGENSHCVIIYSEGKWTKSKQRGLAGKGSDPILGVRVNIPRRDQK